MLKKNLRGGGQSRAPEKRGLTASIRRWIADTSGVVALVVVFCMPAFFAAAGVAVDLAQAYNLKTRLSGALDKAALAGGNTDGTAAEVEERIRAYFDANYPEGALGEAYDITVQTPPGMVDVHAKSKTRTVFMNIFGQEYIDVFAETIVRREITGLELVMVMDNTGSMNEDAGGGATKIQASKTAATKLLDILYGPTSKVETLFVGVVPFSQDVNVGPERSDWVTADSYDYGPEGWAGCVEAREASNRDVTDDPPYALDVSETTTAKFKRYYSACSSTTSNVWYRSVGSEIVSNGSFASGTGWTLGNDWSIGSGVLTKATPTNIVTNGDFASSTGWTTGPGWSIAGGTLSHAMTDSAINGSFSSTANWSLGSGWSIASGVVTKSTTANSSVTETPSPAVISGAPYQVTYTITARTTGSIKSQIGGTSAATARSATGTYTDTITAGAGTTAGFATTDGFKGSIDNISFTPALATTATRSPTTALVSGDKYEVTFTVNSVSAGSVSANIGGAYGTARTSPGTYTETITASNSGLVGFYTANGFVGTVDNLSVKHITLSSKVTASLSTAISSNQNYYVTYTIVNSTTGSVKVTVGNRSTTTESEPGTYTETLKPSSGSTVTITTSDGFEGVIDNLSVKVLSDCGNGPTYVYDPAIGVFNTSTLRAIGPNMYCTAPSLSMTNVRSDIDAKIAAMRPSGATMINLGLAWGWRMLSPRWAGMWGGVMDSTEPKLPLPYDHPGMNKVIILMTDGDNTFGANNYTAYGKLSDGRISTSQTTAENTLDTRTLNLCTTIKNRDILIYTIALGTGVSSASKTMLKNCATSPAYAFVSPSGAELQNVFTTIANQLNSLHVVY
ncbi:MAG: hypothetical protein IT560_08335 [Alphaproteobacteria bacterium]|nr:hypothetical protein [Alphaproteobacteria bacterium]